MEVGALASTDDEDSASEPSDSSFDTDDPNPASKPPDLASEWDDLLFVFDVGLAASVCLQGLWALQTGLSLYVEAFIPEGCHRLLDVVSGVEGSTKCELEDSKLRAIAILDFAFLIHVGVVVILVFVVYAVVSKALGVSRRFGGSYEVLPTAADTNHVQLKTLSGTQA
uniref:Uncharacterized protein n=1 Tax=Chenopodium quinoa TaxID=63459 RepID=A0A803NA69_CHEQI